MRKLKILFICGLVFLLPCIVVAQENSDAEEKYGREMYTTPEVENPDTYNPWSSYEGLVSERMLKSIQKLNKQSLKKIEIKNRPELKEVVELPELSEMFGQKITMEFNENPEEVVPEGVSMEELAEAVVKKLMELKEENKIKGIKETQEEGEGIGAVEGVEEEKTENSNKKSEVEETVEEYEKEVELQGSAITLTYLIFGKEVVIKAPKILADNFEEKENRLKKEIELMATLLNERRKR